MRNLISQWNAKHFHASKQSPSLILGAMSERRGFSLQGGGGVDWYGIRKKANIYVLVILNKKGFFPELFLGDF